MAHEPSNHAMERTPKAFASRLADRRMTSMKAAVTDAQQGPGFPLRIMKQATRFDSHLALLSLRPSVYVAPLPAGSIPASRRSSCSS
jgi:hypothetical protein